METAKKLWYSASTLHVARPPINRRLAYGGQYRKGRTACCVSVSVTLCISPRLVYRPGALDNASSCTCEVLFVIEHSQQTQQETDLFLCAAMLGGMFLSYDIGPNIVLMRGLNAELFSGLHSI